MAPRSDALAIFRRAFTVALIVGTVLNLINQGDAISGDHDINVTKILLTYLVPFFVSAHGAFSAKTPRTKDNHALSSSGKTA